MDTVQARLQALEVKAAFAEDLLDRFNLTVYRQQQEMATLRQQLAQLRQHLRDSGGPGMQGDALDERPPHY